MDAGLEVVPQRFAYASLVSDDTKATVDVLSAIGLVKVWEGTHPFLQCGGTLMATRRGGVLVLATGADAHPALGAVAATKERWFHFALEMPDLAAAPWAALQGVEVSDVYEGPIGRAVMAEVSLDDADRMFVEMVELGAGVSAPGSAFARVESTAMVTSDRVDMAARLGVLGLSTDPRQDALFPTLAGLNRISVLDWHYLEFVEPTDTGVISGLRERLGRSGIFGLNIEPVDMGGFLAVVQTTGLDVNSKEPIVLPVVVEGRDMSCANIITVNPRATGGGRLFVLTPLEYPWGLVG